MFNGRNIKDGFPEELVKVVNLLNEKADRGEFEFSSSPDYWQDHEDIVDSLGTKVETGGYYFAVSLAFLASLSDGAVVFPEGVNVWRWAWSLNTLAEFGGWTPVYIKKIIDAFNGKGDGIDGLMENAAHTYGRKNYENGMELLRLLPVYRIAIMAGLMENNFSRCCKDFTPNENQENFVQAFVRAYRIGQDGINTAYDIAKSFPEFTSANAMTFYLKTLNGLDEGRRTDCEERIKQLLQGETAAYVQPMSNWLFIEKGMSPFVEECVHFLIKGLDAETKKGALKKIDHAIGYRIKDAEFLTRLFVCVAENQEPLDILEMESCLHSLYENKESFVDLTVSMIVHPQGMFRLAGRRLWDTFHLESSDFDVSKLDETLQCIFVVSMLQDFGNPETRLPKLLPLLKSRHKTVKGILNKYLHAYTDEYMGHVSKAIDKCGIKCKEADMIKGYVERRWEVLKERRGMKELQPSYTNYEVLKEALRVEREHRQGLMKEAESSHHSVWKDLAKNVVLARGESWQLPDGRSQKLPHITFSMPARQMAESYTPREKREWINSLLKDWNDTTGDN